MSDSTKEPKLTVRISDGIKENRTLLDAVNRATAFLVKEYPPNPLKDETQEAAIGWELGQHDGPVVIPELSELDIDGSSRTSRRFIPLSQTRDSNSMDIWMLRLLRDVNAKRYEKVSTRWEKMIDDMEEAETNGR